MSSTKFAATPSHADSLRSRLESATVLTPDSTGYAESVKRWSDAAEKPAVGLQAFNVLKIGHCYSPLFKDKGVDLIPRGSSFYRQRQPIYPSRFVLLKNTILTWRLEAVATRSPVPARVMAVS